MVNIGRKEEEKNVIIKRIRDERKNRDCLDGRCLNLTVRVACIE